MIRRFYFEQKIVVVNGVYEISESDRIITQIIIIVYRLEKKIFCTYRKAVNR